MIGTGPKPLTAGGAMLIVTLKGVECYSQIHAGYCCVSLDGNGECSGIAVFPFKSVEYSEVARIKRDEWMSQHTSDNAVLLWIGYQVIKGASDDMFVQVKKMVSTSITDLSYMAACQDDVLRAVNATIADLKRRSVR